MGISNSPCTGTSRLGVETLSSENVRKRSGFSDWQFAENTTWEPPENTESFLAGIESYMTSLSELLGLKLKIVAEIPS